MKLNMSKNYAFYIDSNFEIKKVDRKYTAICLLCKKTLRNTAIKRLKAHRNVCNWEYKQPEAVYLSANHSDVEMTDSVISIKPTDISEQNQITVSTPLLSLPSTSSLSCSLSSPVTSESGSVFNIGTSSTSPLSSNIEPKLKKQKIHAVEPFIEILSKKNEDEINEALADFFFSCNIPFSVIESNYFKKFIKQLRPAYVVKIPKMKALSDTLLDQTYKKCIQKSKETISEYSVLLINSWKNTGSNTKTVATILHNSPGEQTFLNAWDLPDEHDTAEKLCEIIKESITQAKQIYNTTVYAVVSDNATDMIKMEINVDIWHTTSSSHIADLLAKDILNQDIFKQIIDVLKEFQHIDLETKILEKGGAKISISNDMGWCSYRNSFNCFKDNLNIMRKIAADCNKIKTNVNQLIFDDNFIEDVEKSIEMIEPIGHLINYTQKSDCLIADSAKIWIELELPKGCDNLHEKLSIRKYMALNKYALVAYYLHPFYENAKLTTKQHSIIGDFLFENLNAEGLEEWDLFMQRRGHFKLLYEKKLSNEILFWRMAALKHPSLSKLALQLLQIPASSTYIKELFSDWDCIHNNIQNNISIEKLKELIYVHYSLKISDNNEIEEY